MRISGREQIFAKSATTSSSSRHQSEERSTNSECTITICKKSCLPSRVLCAPIILARFPAIPEVVRIATLKGAIRSAISHRSTRNLSSQSRAPARKGAKSSASERFRLRIQRKRPFRSVAGSSWRSRRLLRCRGGSCLRGRSVQLLLLNRMDEK